MNNFNLFVITRVLALLVALVGSTSYAAVSPSTTALAYAEHHSKSLGLSAGNDYDIVISNEVISRHTGVTHVYLQQRYRGLDIEGAIFTVNVAANGKVLNASNRFIDNVSSAMQRQVVLTSAVNAANVAARSLDLSPSAEFVELFSAVTTNPNITMISDGGISSKAIAAELVWLPMDSGVRLAWSLEIEETNGKHWWMAFVDAQTGNYLKSEDLVIHDSQQSIADAIARSTRKANDVDQEQSNHQPRKRKTFPNIDGAAYRVFPLPLENPNDGGRSLVRRAADPAASKFGWHDTDGRPGAEFTVTRGNNVHAYTDLDADNLPDPGSDPDGGPNLSFDFMLDLNLGAETYRPAAVSNLFYWNNIVHDITYAYGFDEAAGNFQVNNHGNGGMGDDDVRAEAQDGSGTNNANFSTPADGNRPRMQMYVWSYPLPNRVVVQSGGAAGSYQASRATFGPQLSDVGAVSGSVVLVNDGTGGSVTDGCEPLIAFPVGSIALIDRGSCRFDSKVTNAQNAGAIAVIMLNNRPGNPVTMSGAGSFSIATVMLTQDNGDILKANLPLSATLSVDPIFSVTRDSDLDAGVIAHEYGHGISNRLTGGPANILCLRNAEQMGEGWSDWFALALTAEASDRANISRGVGTYLLFQTPQGDGIRPTPYSRDLSINPSSYAWVADVARISRPHGIGYVWNTMLWEVYWNLIDRYGFNPDLYRSWKKGGNNLALQLVMDGMKFQPCSPGFVDGRDAILAADNALTGGANQCEIWRGFAKRGLGVSASQGLSSDRTDGVEAFDLPASCNLAVFEGFQPPVANAPAINPLDAGEEVSLKFTLSGMLDNPIIDSQPVDCQSLVAIGNRPTKLRSRIRHNGDSYRVNWETDDDWEGSCRRLTVRIPAANDAVAYFRFD